MIKKIKIILSMILVFSFVSIGSVQASTIGPADIYVSTDAGVSFGSLSSPLPVSVSLGLSGQAIFGFGSLFNTATVTVTGGSASLFALPGTSSFDPASITNLFSGSGWTGAGSAETGSPTEVTLPGGEPISYVGVAVTGVDGGSNQATAADENPFVAVTITASPVPEPATLLLFGAGLIGVAGMGRKKTA